MEAWHFSRRNTKYISSKMQWALIGREKPGVSSSHGSLIYLVSLGHGASLLLAASQPKHIEAISSPHKRKILCEYNKHKRLSLQRWMHSGSHSWAAQYSLSQRSININSVLSITVIMVRFLKGLPQIHIILYSHLPSFSFLGTPSSAPHLSDCFVTLGRPLLALS